MDAWFEDAPLMVAIAHIAFTQSPEVLQRITDIKAGLAGMDLLVAESAQQTNVALNLAGGIPQVSQNPLWWFRTLDRRRAIAVSQNSVVFYDADYDRFDTFLDQVKKTSRLVAEIGGAGCFLTAVALRYISGFASNGAPTPYICAGLHGIPVESLKTSHFHHEYSFWCDVDSGGKLVVKLKTVHGNQLIPQDILATGLALDPKFSLSKEFDAVQLDIYETLQKKAMERLSVGEIEQILSGMRNNIKAAFFAATTERAHERWKRTSK
jgi:uncharacterized protein (TIGR04255 family)